MGHSAPDTGVSRPGYLYQVHLSHFAYEQMPLN